MASRSSATESGRLLGRWTPEVVPGHVDPGPAAEGADAAQAGVSTASPTVADPSITAALALGWEMADLYATRGAPPVQGDPPATLPSAEELGQRPEAALERVSMLIARALGDAGVQAASIDGLRALGADDGGWRAALLEVHTQLTTALGAHDTSSLGAYDVGRALADTCREPRDLSELIDRLDAPALLSAEGRLADLSSRLPPHSAAAVSATIAQWKAWTADARARENLDDVRGALARQGALWRALLTGEKDARQMLDPEMVIAASVRHASRLGTLIRGLAGAYLPALGLLTAVSALLVYVIIVQSPVATVVAALGALAAALFVVRKTLSLTVVETIEDLRPGLWGAEIDAAVAQSILRLPPRSAPAKPSKPAPAATPAGYPEPLNARFRHRVERALHVTRSARAQGYRVPASGPESAAAPAQDDGPVANGDQPSS
ncbi:MAG: hypothetical protein WAK93_04040 [Solirubrobacteraceae bacterium]